MVKAIKKKPSPFPFALRQDTIVTQMSRGTEVALIMVELGYSRRFSSMVAPFLEVMSRYLFPYVERWGRLLSAPPPRPHDCLPLCILLHQGRSRRFLRKRRVLDSASDICIFLLHSLALAMCWSPWKMPEVFKICCPVLAPA